MTFLLTAVSVVSVDPLFSDANASIGSDEFCDDNPSHFACDNKNDNDENDNEISDDKESNLSDEEKDEKKKDPVETCYGAGYDDGKNREFNTSVYNDNCYGEYSDGFIDGCMSADNTRDVCESATDA